MRIVLRHPGRRAIGAFASGDLSRADRVRLAAHLADCAACRSEVTALRALLADMRTLPSPQPSAAILERALARRAAGERLVLPAAVHLPPTICADRSRWMIARGIAALAAVVLIAITVLLVGRTPPLAAGAVTGELQLTPQHPQPGDVVRVAYRPSAVLSDAGPLRLRARLRSATTSATPDGMSSVVAAVLRRDADGIYRGDFRLAPAVVYAALAVEDSTASHVDAHLERFWDLLAGDTAGVPLLEALRAHVADAAPRDWETAFATARQMVQLHPDRAESWRTRFVMDAELAGASRIDSLRAVHRPVLHRLDRELRAGRNASSAEMGAMWRLSCCVGEDSISTYWADRLRREAPASAAASELYFADASAVPRAERLQRIEALWASSAPDARPSALAVLFLATQLGDVAAIRRWGDRTVVTQPALAGMVASQFADIPALRAEGMARLRLHLATLARADDARRALEQSREADAARRTSERLGLLATLGRALVAEGQVRAAYDTLALATTTGWDPTTFALLGDVRLRLGDTTGALHAHALAAADVGTPVDSVRVRRARLGGIDDERWDAAVAAARVQMRARVMATGTYRVLSKSPRLTDASGALRPLSAFTDGRITLVAFWSRYCGPSLSELASLQRTARALERDGARVVAVTAELPSPALRDFLRDRGLTFSVHHDARGEARQAFGAHGTPLYYVLDADGAVRFRPGSLAAVPRLVAALRE